ncbi:MAG: hypothetical protein US89_C0013G0050 [Candidatus Peregrinibacteria bacterium GW2011_GWF2_38_29]|nr:MAG: hypothetical protein US89_C0013G0050 [Candidatus Peregrinibacteria bacterium GW2011_GWF2_38_29]HBB02429.1 hypothetical protein [Candidatus Peregrinibacteria bacterium]
MQLQTSPSDDLDDCESLFDDPPTNPCPRETYPSLQLNDFKVSPRTDRHGKNTQGYSFVITWRDNSGKMHYVPAMELKTLPYYGNRAHLYGDNFQNMFDVDVHSMSVFPPWHRRNSYHSTLLPPDARFDSI